MHGRNIHGTAWFFLFVVFIILFNTKADVPILVHLPDIHLAQDTVPKPIPVPPPPPKPTNPVLCLAQNIFYEAGNEPYEAQQAVAATVFNRVAMPWYPNTICGVVYQKRQYSWTLDYSRWKRRPPSRYMELAKTFLQERDMIVAVLDVTHFHHVDISPKWAGQLQFAGTIGAHHFYEPAPAPMEN